LELTLKQYFLGAVIVGKLGIQSFSNSVCPGNVTEEIITNSINGGLIPKSDDDFARNLPS
jgi:hypothetical protein